jgi:hypothetical protein
MNDHNHNHDHDPGRLRTLEQWTWCLSCSFHVLSLLLFQLPPRLDWFIPLIPARGRQVPTHISHDFALTKALFFILNALRLVRDNVTYLGGLEGLPARMAKVELSCLSLLQFYFHQPLLTHVMGALL